MVYLAGSLHDKDIEDYVKEWDSRVCKGHVYGIVVTSTIGTSPFDDPQVFHFHSPQTRDRMLNVMLLFAIKRLSMLGECKLKFPSRYAYHSKSCNPDYLVMHEILKCIGRGTDELPMILPHYYDRR